MALAMLEELSMDILPSAMARGQLMLMLMPTMVLMAMEDMPTGLLMAMVTGGDISMARGQLMPRLMHTTVPMAMEDIDMGLLMVMATGAGISMVNHIQPYQESCDIVLSFADSTS